MTEPTDKAQALLARYKTAAALPVDHKARLLDVVSERVARGDVPRFDVHTPPPVAAEPTLLGQVWASAWGKLGLGLVALGLPATGLYALRDAQAPAFAPMATSAPRRVESSAAPAAETAAAPPSLAPRAEVPEAGSRDVQSSRSERALAPASEPTIDEEVRLLKAAQSALQGGQPQRALSLLSEHAGRFPHGKLASLRQVTRMLALCQAGQAEKARQEARQFVAQNPASPLVDRVKTICAAESKDR